MSRYLQHCQSNFICIILAADIWSLLTCQLAGNFELGFLLLKIQHNKWEEADLNFPAFWLVNIQLTKTNELSSAFTLERSLQYFSYVILEHFASNSDIWMPCFALICNKKWRKRMGFDSKPQKVPTQKQIDIHLFDWLWLQNQSPRNPSQSDNCTILEINGIVK